MINPLLITRKENAGILRRICSELNAVPREMIGEDWSLAVFLNLNEVMVLPFEPDPFAVERYEDMLDMEFSVIVP